MDENSRPALSEERVATLFSARRANSFIVREIASRTHERLDLMKLDPRVVLDLGCGDQSDRHLLEQRFPAAQVIGIDLAPLVNQSPAPSVLTGLRRMFARKTSPPLIRADFTALPLADASADLAWSNCALHWVGDGERAIAEWARVLKPDGALLFSCFGPDSLREVRSAFEQVDQAPHVLSFTDMHDYGDMLASHGFAQPVMDMERMTLTYATPEAFWRDVRDLGGNPLTGARRGLLGRTAKARLDQALTTQRNADGLLELSIEIVTGHAWKGRPRGRTDGLAVVAMPTLRR